MDKKAIIQFIILILLLVTIVIIFRVTGLNSRLNLAQLQNYLASFGIWAPVVFLVIYTLRPLVLFPGTILTIVAAFLFGVFWGTVYATLGATFGALVAFGLARKLGRDAVAKFIRGKFAMFDEKVAENGFLVIFILRLVPVIIPSFDAVNFGAGFSKIRFWDFTFGTLLGLIPGTLFLVAVSIAAVTPSSPRFWLPLVAWSIFIILALIYLNRKRKHGWNLLN
ncbi:MAG: TVP38/TMEM64 family protein [bacterium]|nr:TVP38/TMEM64 family protein [bacterium]